jgi:uncharacterized membrane protein YuzA (DUF378 family)
MRVALFLVVLGAFNCASMGLMRDDLISSLLGRGAFGKAAHLLIGVAAILITLKLFGITEGFENNAVSMDLETIKIVGEEGFNGCKDRK